MVRTGSSRGKVEGVTKSLEMLAQKLHELVKEQNMHLDSHHLTILLEQKNCGCIIGQKGCKISETRKASQATIKISNEPLMHSTEKTVEISGNQKQVFHALRKIVKEIGSDDCKIRTIRKFLSLPGGHNNGYRRRAYPMLPPHISNTYSRNFSPYDKKW